ncbi:MAG: lamin tail domain-containing protein [Crocinitomicaceae bacterium]|nr:lamin tail domain-containing protein [Crocinitomicaceae bacterium]
MKQFLSLLVFIMFSMMAFSQATTLFISEIAEGSSNNKYLEIYNGTGTAVDLSNFSLSSCSNGCNVFGEFDFPDNVTFPAMTMLADGDVYIIAHPSADASILAVADMTFNFLSNGNDTYALTNAGATASVYTIIDIVGDLQGNPGSGWPVADDSNGTQNQTLVRKSTVCNGNPTELGSFGTDAASSEWIVYPLDDWTNINTHTSSCVATCDSYNTETITACTSYTSPSGLYTWTTDGSYNDTIPNAALCDSIITFNLTIAQVYNETAAETICSGSSYIFGTQTLTTQGQYTEVFTSVDGCDSTVILDLAVVASYNENATASICDGESYIFGTQTLTIAGPYTELFTSSTGCDSTVNLDLIVLAPTTSSITEVVCSSYTAPDGAIYTTSGIQTAVIPNASGCDSTITIDLTVNTPSSNTVIASACDSYVANAITYTTSGVYTQTMMNAAGCDSVITFDITITPTPVAPTVSGDETYCFGDILNDMVASGTALDSLIISGVADATLPGGVPKCIEFYAIYDIADLSSYGFGSANNGGGTDGEEFTFPALALSAGSTYKVATDSANYFNFFGEYPNNTASFAANVNGDDAIELFHNGVVIDVFGDINTDGTGQPWEYLDGWAYRNNNAMPNGGVFGIGEWTFSGINVLDGATDNVTSASPFPLGTFTSVPPVSEINWFSDAALTTNVGTGSTLAPSGALGATIYYVNETILGSSTCEGPASMITITVNALPTMDPVVDQELCANDATTAVVFTSADNGVSYDWTNSEPSINLGASGSGDITSFNATNPGTTVISAIINVTPIANGCAGTSEEFTITVNPSPVLTFDASTACIYDDAFALVATPTGGTFSGTGVSGADFDPATAGNGVHTITYDYTDANSCSASISADITVDDCASISENNINNVSIFPNPATDVITLTFNSDKADVTIYSIQGKVMSANTIQSSDQINTTNLVSGTYMVKVVVNNNTFTQRLIIK